MPLRELPGSYFDLGKKAAASGAGGREEMWMPPFRNTLKPVKAR
jgi:hypothetical protein